MLILLISQQSSQKLGRTQCTEHRWSVRKLCRSRTKYNFAGNSEVFPPRRDQCPWRQPAWLAGLDHTSQTGLVRNGPKRQQPCHRAPFSPRPLHPILQPPIMCALLPPGNGGPLQHEIQHESSVFFDLLTAALRRKDGVEIRMTLVCDCSISLPPSNRGRTGPTNT
jgi:hypothetical protein